jgi:chemotaxis protein CheD
LATARRQAREEIDASMIRIFDHDHNKERIVLSPGEYVVSSEDVLLYTLLGSCVAVCLRDPLRGIAGMNHFLLPENLHEGTKPCGPPGRFGRRAMDLLVEQMLAAGAVHANLVAKVMGGAHVLWNGSATGQLPDRNVEFALSYLSRAGVPVAAQDTGGQRGRRVGFDVLSGQVFVEKLRPIDAVEPDGRVPTLSGRAGEGAGRECGTYWLTSRPAHPGSAASLKPAGCTAHGRSPGKAR